MTRVLLESNSARFRFRFRFRNFICCLKYFCYIYVIIILSFYSPYRDATSTLFQIFLHLYCSRWKSIWSQKRYGTLRNGHQNSQWWIHWKEKYSKSSKSISTHIKSLRNMKRKVYEIPEHLRDVAWYSGGISCVCIMYCWPKI